MSAQKSRITVAITAADYFEGYEVARNILSERIFGENVRLIVTAVHVDRLRDLERRGAEARKIDPDNIESMERVYRESDVVILLPIPEDRRVETTKRVLEAIEKAKVKTVILLSYAGADTQESSLKSLHEYHEIEKDFRNRNFKNWTILRYELLQDWFLAWSSYVENKGAFPLSTGRDQRFPPIRVEDLTNALKEITKHEIEELSSGHGKHHGQVYHLTGPETLTGNKLVDELNRAVQPGRNVKFEEVSREKIEEILREIRNRNPGGRQENENQQSNVVQQPLAANPERQDDRRNRFQGQPTHKQIETIADYFEYVRKGHADRTTNDLKKLTGRDGHKIEVFFKENANEFRPDANRA